MSADSAQGPAAPALEIENLKKTFKIGFRRKVVEAVQGVSLAVQPGEVFGFLGPNGAGKTTTIKSVMGLIRPSSGQVRLFGRPSDARARREVGFLPEQPYFYDYLKPRELLRFMGRLHGMSRKAIDAQADELIPQVGLAHAWDRTLRKFSKGMLQRMGIAQAFLGNPKLVILDEPLSGLDPIGRKEMKDVLSAARDRGTTLFLSSHILADIELICDRVAIIDKGRVIRTGRTQDLLTESATDVEILAGRMEGIRQALEGLADDIQELGDRMRIITDQSRRAQVLAKLNELGAELHSVIPRSASLEEVFVRIASGKEASQ